MAEHSIQLILESLLFASGKPLSLKEMQRVLPDRTLPEITEALKALVAEYDALNRSYLIKQVAEGYQMRTKPEYSVYITQMLRRSANSLSRAAMETLDEIVPPFSEDRPIAGDFERILRYVLPRRSKV